MTLDPPLEAVVERPGERLTGDSGRSFEDTWRRRLAGAPQAQALALATDRPRPAAMSDPAASVRFVLPAELCGDLAELARRRQADLSTLLLAAFTVLLHRFTGQTDMLVALPAGIPGPAAAGSAAGPESEPAAVRADLAGDPLFVVLMDRVRAAVEEAAAHPGCPWLGLESAPPAVAFGLRPAAARPHLGAAELEPLPLEIATAAFDLELRAAPAGGGALLVRLLYRPELFDPPTLHRLGAAFHRLLAEIALDPGRPLSALAVIGAPERQQLLVEWNDTAAAATPRPGCLHELVAAQAGRTPEAAALIGQEGGAWTYRELDRSANRLARYLRSAGVGPEVRVGVCLERVPELVMTLLAVLKAGGAYVPLDASYPVERLRLLLEDSAARVVVTHRAVTRLPGGAREAWRGTGCRTIELETAGPAIAAESSEPPVALAEARNLAYLIYTSGSTGRPKGVAVEHRNALQLLAWARQAFSAAELMGVLASTSICFDLSIFEIFVPLSLGGRVILVRDALALPELRPPLRDTVTLVNTVPSAIAALLRAGALPPAVHTVNVAGEALKGALVAAIYGAPAVERVLNLYGPSEDTTYSTCASVPRGEREPAIGRPIPGTQVFVLDPSMRSLPLGVPGELYLGGDGLARGYLGRPELTAERFVPHPFAAVAGARLYRTGDLVRHRPAGDLEFLGRLDHQVKVRGFRIELGEIEAALARHPAVRDAVVVVRAGAGGEDQLLAYVEADAALAAGDLQAWLAGRLPAHMVPGRFQVLPALPRTANLKVDRRALPEPERGLAPAGRAPATPLERVLAETMGELLGLEAIPVDADFLALGAHSLLLAQLIARVRDRLAVDLELAEIFRARTLEALAERIAARQRAGVPPSIPPIRRASRERDLPLSFAQERIWFLEQVAPGNLAYNFQLSLRFRGPFDPGALAAAGTEIVRRHEILRTTFPAPGGRPLQRIHPPFPLRIPRIDLDAVAGPVRREAEAERRLAEALARPFVVTKLPLFRWLLFRLADDDHVLLHVEHHLVHDGWSVGLILDELKTLYRAGVTGRPVALPELAVQYADYAVWQREWLQGKALERQLDFWQRRLAGSPPALDLPADRPRAEAHSFHGNGFFFLLPADLLAALRRLSRAEGGSLFVTLLAAFDCLLQRLTGQDDLVVATGIANRRLRELEAVVGMMVNTVVVRNDLGGRPTFRQLLDRTRDGMLEVHEHQDMPFELLVERLRPERRLDRNPLYQVMFAFHDAAMPALSFGDGLATTLRYRHNRSAKVDLNVIGIPHAEQRRGTAAPAASEEMLFIWEHSADLFDPATVRRWWDHYLTILRGAVEDPARRLDELPYLADAQRHQLLTEWNETPAPAAPGAAANTAEVTGIACLHQLFAGQVTRRPEAIALVLGERRLSYSELDRRAARVGRRLAAAGVGPGVRVGLFAERSLEMVVALLGILEAGAAYVPLDPMYPAERLAFLVADSGLGALVAESALAATMPALDATVLFVDAGGTADAAEPAQLLPASPAVTARDLAYVIYTSGSTGWPKGVEIEHGSAVNVVRAAIRDFALRPGSRVLQMASISFDASVLEIFMTLGAGGTLYLVDHETRLASHRLQQLIAAHDVEVIVSPPSLLDTLAPAALPSIATVIAGGEATTAETLRRWAPGRRYFNCYAPTESTIYSTVQRCEPRGERAPSLGRPIDGCRVYLLDRGLRPVPIGATGEIHIGGAGVARGYLGRPELTAQSFTPDPVGGGAPGDRLYRTGDLARHLPDGRLEFAGRFDQQVKIRGLRIELGEIEAVAARHPAVSEAVVVVDRGSSTEPRLVAYVVPRDTAAFDRSTLREFLQSRLPAYMVPAVIVPLDSLPITVHGKVDLRALPAPAAAASAAAFAPPAGAVEEIVAAIWGAVLHVEQVGAHDDFFALGGHSLIAAQVMARIEEVFAVRLPLRTLFEGPDVRRLAAAVERARQSPGPPPPALERIARDGPLPVSFAQQRMWFLAQLEPGSAAYNVSFAFAAHGPLSVPALAAAATHLAARHEALRTTFPSDAGWPVQRVAAVPRAPLTVVDMAGLPATVAVREARRLAPAAAARACDLAGGPLLRLAVLRLAMDEHLLLILTHHVVLDGSAHLFLRELGLLYESALRRVPPVLAALPVQYVDFAHWQRRWLAGDLLSGQLAYWTRQLGGELPRLALPTDRPPAAVRGTRGAQHVFALGGGLGDGLRALAAARGVTLFMALLAAFEVLLHRYSGQPEICVGIPIADRPHRDLEDLIGCFVNTLVLRLGAAGRMRFADLLLHVREVTLDAYAHKDLPFEMLVDALALARDPSRTPLFQVMFVSHTTPPPCLRLPELEVSSMPLGSGGARFDWLLLLRPEGTGLGGSIEYSRDLFERTTIVRMTGHLEQMLTGIVTDPDGCLEELPLLAAAERHQLLAEWNDTVSPYAEARLVHHLVEEQVARRPDAVALLDERGAWSYGELDARANRLAHQLLALGVRPGEAVGVHLDRSAATVAALLAVLKAGGAYVPLDATLPVERLCWILAKLAVRHLVTSERLRARLAERATAPPRLDGIVALDLPAGGELPAGGRLAGRREIDAQPCGPPPAAACPDQAAYVIFTSGSSGEPKGVAVGHRAVVNLITWINRDFDVRPDDRILFLTSFGFDLSVYDTFGILAAGGSVRVVAQDDVRDPERLLGLLLAEPITFWDSAPAALEQLVPFLPAAPAPGARSLRRVFLSGDWIPTSLPGRVRAAFPAARVISLGGATEATVWSNVFPIGAVDPRWVSIPYGRPMPNARYHVLAPSCEPCPIGVEGELYIAGDCLASGYAGEPALTAERFLPDPLGQAGGRLYWTGDRARHLPDGNLELLGRRDQQVKVRGFRVELGEIEAVLARHPAVRQAVVVARGEAGERSLAAYLVPRGAAPPAAEVRQYLAASLPEYMVPAAIVTLAELPLTASGKLDRKALPLPDRSAMPTQEIVAPRTVTEVVLAGLWSELLVTSPISSGDDFFALGGHSLLATRLVSRVRDALGLDPPLRDIFEHPTLAGLARRLDQMHPDGEAALPPLVAAPRDGEPPQLSFAQERLWFLDQLTPGTAVYNVAFCLRLRGRLDRDALDRGLREIVRRHQVLRTVFESHGGARRAIVRPAPGAPLPRVDLQALPATVGERVARDVAAGFATRPFDLAAGPLVRFLLAELAVGERLLLINMHHIVSDGWSIGLFLAELGALYGAFAAGRPSPLPELAVQYADFAAWQRRWLTGGVLAAQLDYWRERLAGMQPALTLPIDRVRPPVPSFRGGHRRLRLAPALLEETRRLGRGATASLFMTLLAAFQALLAHDTGETDIPVGSPVANRRVTGVEGLIGMFVNTLVMRGDLAGDGSFDQLLAATREAALAAFTHQDLPFEQLVEEVAPLRDLSHAPLFQALFALQNPAVAPPRLAALEITLEPIDTGISKYDLAVVLTEQSGELLGDLTYSRDLFDATSAERLARRFAALVAAVVAHPERRLSELSLLGEAERWQLLHEWNDRRAPYRRDGVIHELFAGQAARTPDAVAVVAGDHHLSYGALDSQSRHLAGRLQERGVEPEAPVAVAMERSPEMVVALLGILRAGACYLPIDAQAPRERALEMVRDAGAALLLTRDEPDPRFAGSPLEQVAVTVAVAGLPAGLAPRPPPVVWPESLAYVLYTSGSMGRPMGVRVPHRALVRLVDGNDFAAFGAGETFLQLAPLAFDASTFEIWGPLLHGGRLVLMPPGQPSLEEIGEVLGSRQITTLWLTAGLFHAMVENRLGDLAGLRQLIAGGEVLSATHVHALRQAYPWVRLINGYGPTENTTFTCCHPIETADEIAAGSIPIGRPIRNTRALVLDGELRPRPIGLAGELYAGGDGLARDYLRQPALTAARFVPDPFAAGHGERLYYTGDWARYLADGRIEFLGRVDRQIKLRGFRIEPAEIEAALCQHWAVREAAVLVRREAADKQLVAYLVITASAVASSCPAGRRDRLRRHLRKGLPEYMIPAVFVEVAALPLTPNGKVDRDALAALAPAIEEAWASEPEVLPQTPYAELVAGIFARVLGQPRLSPTDNFFDLGGHSLAAIQALSRLRGALGIEIPLREIFERPTVAALAARLAEIQRGAADEPLITPTQGGEAQRPAPLSFAQERLWILDRLHPGNPAYNVHAVFRLGGPLDLGAFRRALGELVRRHATLRTRFELADGEPVQIVEAPTDRPLPGADLSRLEPAKREAECRRLALEAVRRPFDLTRCPLLRTLLVRLDGAGEEHALVLTLHHIVADGWSINIFYRELALLYDAALRGLSATLPVLPIQYTDFARWQRRWAAAGGATAQAEFWRRQLAGAPPVLELPLDHPRPPIQTYRGRRAVWTLPADLCAGLRELAREADATFFMTLMAGYKALLLRWTGVEDLAVGISVANRGRTEIEGLIGFFVNTLVLRTQVRGDLTFAELLAEVRAGALAAYSHQDLPFEHLVEVLNPLRDARYPPLFQVMFSYQDGAVVSRHLRGIVFRAVEIDPGTAKFDLSLLLHQGEGGLHAVFEHNADLFDAATMARLARQLQALLAGCAAGPAHRLAELPLLDAAEQAALIREWNDTAVDGPPPRLASELVAAAAAARPEALAVCCGADRLTFGELERRANRLACHLRGAGVDWEVPVGLHLDRCLDLLPAILGIWKAGGAFVPLPPDQPAKRRAHLLADARIRVIVSRTDLAADLPADGARVVLLDADAAAIASLPCTAPPGAPAAGGLAYVLYTSGSTGLPKGTLVSHGALANYLRFCHGAYPMAGGAPVHSSLGFDLTLTSLLAPLAAGEPVSLLPEQHTLEILPAALRRPRQGGAAAAGAWGFVKLTPSHLELLRGALEPAELAGACHALIVGGEPLRFEQLAPWRAHAPETRLINEYGPTETVVGCSAHEVAGGDDATGPVPIGRPIPGARLLVLDPALALLPPGSGGEICVAGAGLARGYLGRPELTAERFVPDPWSPLPGGRLYRTGDRGRHRSDGVLEFLGRTDRQVKLHGHRVELGEIEAVLRRCPGVRAAAVVARDDLPGGRGLAAYWVADTEDPTAAEVRRFAAGELPPPMVPAAFTRVVELPLNRHGKLDAGALPAPDRQAPRAAALSPAAPETELERRLAALVGEVLRLADVGRDDSFFDLGAHSLTLVRMHERLRADGFAAVTVIDLFRHPTVRGLADHLGGGAAASPAGDGAARAEARTAAAALRQQRRERRQVSRSS